MKNMISALIKYTYNNKGRNIYEKEKKYIEILKWKIEIIIRETKGSNGCQFKITNCKVTYTINTI